MRLASSEGGFPVDAFHQLAALEPGNYWFEARNQLIVWALNRYFPSAQSLLEIGCGTGFVLQGIRKARPAMELTASDFYDEGLAVARARVPDAHFTRLDATKLDGTEQFDVVTAFDVLEHIAEDTAAVTGLAAAARPGGGLIVTVPQHQWLWSDVDVISQHVRRYSRSELVNKVRAAGFEPLLVTSFVSLLLPAMAFSRWRTKREAVADANEFHVHPLVNASLRRILDLERALIKCGARWPAGGSLLLVARRK